VDAGIDVQPQRALARSFPALAQALGAVELAEFPTPLERTDELGRRLGGVEIWLKRDDRAGERYGGSKVRKLEYLLGDAERRGFHSVLAQGGMGSNQTLATALYAKERGLHAILLLLPEQPSAETRAHLLAQQALGAEQHLIGVDDGAVGRFVKKLPEGERPYVIATGGSSPLGDVGFVAAGFELAEQIAEAKLPVPEVVYLPLGTGGSAVGLALGLAAAGLSTRVVAVRTASMRYGTPPLLRKAAKETNALLHDADASFPLLDFDALGLEVRNGYVGRGYALPTTKGKKAQALAHDAAGLELDLTYSSKALAALIDDAPTLVGKHVVFWVTFDPRPVSVEGTSPADLPADLRPYAR
jgi:1-aminocyclopropane-1-carboxylate deaminase/D-cysteine desulfhydrase-like pyridoxal-dependent ACC family enzyme